MLARLEHATPPMNNFDNRRREVSMALQKAEAALGRAEDGAGQEGRGHDVRFQLRLLAVSLRLLSVPPSPAFVHCHTAPLCVLGSRA